MKSQKSQEIEKDFFCFFFLYIQGCLNSVFWFNFLVVVLMWYNFLFSTFKIACQEKRLCAQTETKEILSEHQEKLLLLYRWMKYWHRLLIEVMEFPSLCIFKSHLDMVLGNQLYVTLLKQGSWTRWPLEVSSNTIHSVILWYHHDSTNMNEVQ